MKRTLQCSEAMVKGASSGFRNEGHNGRKSAQMLQFKFSPKDMFDMPNTIILNSCDQNN